MHSEKPFNAEPPGEVLADSFLTPNELFYVRNHFPVPLIESAEYMLEIDAPGRPIKRYTLNQLMHDFPKESVVSAVQVTMVFDLDVGFEFDLILFFVF